jgi:hypothetical protein
MNATGYLYLIIIPRRKSVETENCTELTKSCNGRKTLNPFDRTTATRKQSGPSITDNNDFRNSSDLNLSNDEEILTFF